MIVSVQPSVVSGTVHAPASKSAMQRACAAALVRKGETYIHNPGESNDDLAAIDVIRQLGAVVNKEDDVLKVVSNGIKPIAGELHCGESGLGIRMFTPLAAVSPDHITINGSGSLVNRPMDFFDTVLPSLQVNVESHNGKLPLTIKGPLQPKNIEVDGSLSSQFLTGLLMAYAAANAKDITITVNYLKSRPYIDLTLEIMQQFGLKTPVNKDYRAFYFDDTVREATDEPLHYTVEGDWSGAAFLLVAGAVAGNVQVNGLHITSKQADKKILEALELAGASVAIDHDHVQVRKNKLQPFTFDATDCPDLFPPLAALAANCKGTTIIKGLKRLKHKESDRGLTLQEEFAKLGTRIVLDEDEMQIHGNDHISVNDPQLRSHHDHRIAMACAVMALNADRAVAIHHADAVKKSYPHFWDHLKQLNAVLSLKPFTTDNTFRL